MIIENSAGMAGIVARLTYLVPEPYHMVAHTLGVKVSDLRLIAVHAWDIARATAAGCSAAFVARPAFLFDLLFPRPDVVGADLREVARSIIEREKKKIISNSKTCAIWNVRWV